MEKPVTQHLPGGDATMGAPMCVGRRELVGGRLASTLGSKVATEEPWVNIEVTIAVAE
jgi:hypothetical protein